MSNLPKNLLTIIVITSTLLSAAHAGVLYDDQFQRTGDLYGSSPAPVDALGSTWSDNLGTNGYKTNGSALILSGPASDLVGLSFNLADSSYTNSIITLSANILINSNSGSQWVGFGFSNGNDIWASSPGGALSWMMLFGNGNVFLNASSAIPTQTVNSAFSSLSTVNARIDFNTATKKADFYVNSSAVGSITFASVPTTDRVMIYGNGFDSATGSVDNFVLSTTPVPEPTAITLSVLALIAVAIRRKKAHQ